MTRRRAFCAIALALTIGATPPSGSLQARVDAALASPEVRGAHVGFLAVDATSGAVLCARDADGEFSPASNFKLLVGSAALADLGPNFAFVTTIGVEAAPRNGVIAGNLYLRGGGDAHLSAADLASAARAIAQSGVTRIEGAVIADASHDDAQRYPLGWSWDDLPYDYAPVVSALELEEGVVHVYVTPGAAAGASVTLRVAPQSGAFTVANDATTGAPRTEDTTDVVRPWDSPSTIAVIGSYPAGAPESDDLAASVPDPPRYAGDVLLRALNNAGIAVSGGVRSGVAPSSVVTLWTHRSSPLPQLVAQFWLPSDNLMGELFLKELGAARAGEPGSYAKGFGVEREYLRSLGIDPSTVSLADGSGLSVYNRITPSDLVTILQSDWNGPQRQTVLDALPEAGVRGTLAHSFAGTPLVGKLFAKTGSERHTRALSGFLQTSAYGTVTFSLLVNGWLGDERSGGAARLQRFEASVLSALDPLQ